MRKPSRPVVGKEKTQLSDWLRIHWKNYDIPLWSLSIGTAVLILATVIAKI